ncbi:LysR substrate-binding domain-containing protein [Agrobacterium sp. NPDC089420]|uniref:LysR substrate-binding domain-containing protein n=1 Tax=Agrobacterium sp. NPDC089420 TaxID=3363918 RepID=UPI00384E9A6B
MLRGEYHLGLFRRDIANELSAGRLVQLLPEFEPPPRALHALFASDRRMTPKLRSFLDFATEKFGEGKR